MKTKIILLVTSILLPMFINASESIKDDIMITFEQFIKAQNEHDVVALNNLLLDSPDFLWITKGQAVWGKDQALKRFENLYKGTWKLDPDLSDLKILILDKNSRHLYVPITFLIGEYGQEPKQIKFLMNMILVNESGNWKISAILPIQSAD